MRAWEQFLQQQETDLGKETVEKWLRSLKVQRFDACNLYLEAKDSFQTLWFEEHIRSKVLEQFVNSNHKKIKVHLALANASPSAPKKRGEKLKKNSTPPFKLGFDETDPYCTFPHFIVSDDNKLIYKVFAEITGYDPVAPTVPPCRFNPIYIHGPAGSGKSHLLMSAAKEFQARGMKSVYVRAETFTDHVVLAIRAGEMSHFRQSYRNIDVLLVDDIHVFSRKGATQEEFFHTFNTLHLEGKQIILSANCSPQALQFIEERLISRFEWGVVLPVIGLQKEPLHQLLQTKAALLNFPLSEKIATFLTETFVSNPKALMKGLEALILRLHLDENHSLNSLTTASAKLLLKDLIEEEQKIAITPDKIIRAVAEHYGIRAEDILGKVQTRECSLPRQLAMYICRQHLKIPYIKIGDLFSRDHSTVMTSVRQIQKWMDQAEKHVATALHAILKKLT